MNLYFFYKNKSDKNWYAAEMEVWEENDNTYKEGKRVSSFTMIESLSIHICKHHFSNTERKYHSCRFDHDFGVDSSIGDRASNIKEFRKSKEERDGMEEIRYRDFQRLKKIMFKIYHAYPVINYTERLLKESPACRILA